MGVSVKWDNSDKSVIRYSFKGNWTLADYDKSIAKSFQMTESVPHKVDVILDMSLSGAKIPNGFILYVRRKITVAPDNRGDYVIVSHDNLIKAAIRVVRSNLKSISHRIIGAESLQEARALLSEDRTQPAKPPSFLEALEAARQAK